MNTDEREQRLSNHMARLGAGLLLLKEKMEAPISRPLSYPNRVTFEFEGEQYTIVSTSLLDSQVAIGTHGFAPMDSLSDVCGAYTSDGYCWRPKKHLIHGTGMGLHKCNTPAQGFNAEREKKVAEQTATTMRTRCVTVVRDFRQLSSEEFERKYGASTLIEAMEALTLEQGKEKQ